MVVQEYIKTITQGGNDDFVQLSVGFRGRKRVKILRVEVYMNNPIIAADWCKFQITTTSKAAIGTIADKTVKWLKELELPAGAITQINFPLVFRPSPNDFEADGLYFAYDCDNDTNDTITFKVLVSMTATF